MENKKMLADEMLDKVAGGVNKVNTEIQSKFHVGDTVTIDYIWKQPPYGEEVPARGRGEVRKVKTDSSGRIIYEVCVNYHIEEVAEDSGNIF